MNAASFIHLHHVNHDGRTLGEQEEKAMAQAEKKAVASDMNEQQDVVTIEHADTAVATNQPQEAIAS